MPILKTDILGSEIEINYEDTEKEKLIKLISQFKKRLSEFPQNIKINDKAIIFLSGLKVEDELQENKKLLSNNIVDKNKIDEQLEIILKLNNEIILLKNEANELKSKNLIKSSDDLLLMEKVQNLQKLLKSIQFKIKDELN